MVILKAKFSSKLAYISLEILIFYRTPSIYLHWYWKYTARRTCAAYGYIETKKKKFTPSVVLLSIGSQTSSAISVSLCHLYNIIRIKHRTLRSARHVLRMEEGRNAFKILIYSPTGKKSLGRSWRRWEDDIRRDLKEICVNTRNWADSTQGRDYWRAGMNAALNLRLSYATYLVGY